MSEDSRDVDWINSERSGTSAVSNKSWKAARTLLKKSISSFQASFCFESEEDTSDSDHRMTLYGDVTAPDSFQRSHYVPKHLRYTGRLQPARLYAFRIVRSQWFDAGIGLVIVVNALCIGLEQLNDPEAVHGTHEFEILENAFLAIYWSELLLRFFAIGPRCIRDNWIKSDAMLVVIGTSASFLSKIETLSKLLVLRAARLLRIARTIRLLVKFQELWMLVKGVSGSFHTMFYTALLLLITLYVFSCMGIELITRHPLNIGDNAAIGFQEFVELHFRNLPRTMVTLVQFVTGDSMHAIYLPLIEADPLLAVYFFSLILLVSIVMMNLVTAVIVNTALEEASKDKEIQKAQTAKERTNLIKEMTAVFERLDSDGSGTVSLEELQAISGEDKAVLTHACMSDDLVTIFNAIDIEGEGCLSIGEFCDGVYDMTVSHKSIEMQRMERQLESLHKMVRGSISLQRDMYKCLGHLGGEGTLSNRDLESTIDKANKLLNHQFSQLTCGPTLDCAQANDGTLVAKNASAKACHSPRSRNASVGKQDALNWAQQLAEIARAEAHKTDICIGKLRGELARRGLITSESKAESLMERPFNAACSLMERGHSPIDAPALVKQLEEAVRVDAHMINMSAEQLYSDLVESRGFCDTWASSKEPPLLKPLPGGSNLQKISRGTSS